MQTVDLREKKYKKARRRRRFLLAFIIASILLHILIFLVANLFMTYKESEIAKKPKEQPKFIEISELPVPKEKETEPPKEVKRLAERSHTAKEEKTKDDFTKRPSVAQKPRPKIQPQKRQQKVVKKEEARRKSTKIASIPKEILRDPDISKSKIKEEPKVDSKADDQPSESASSQFALREKNSPEFQGAGDVKQKEDTVDLNTTEFKYLSYFLKLKRQIEAVWNYPELSRMRGEQGELFMVFTIRSDGYLENINLIDSSGYSRLDDEALRAVRVASPFSPFPRSWELDRLNIRGIFRYSFGWTIQ